MGWPRRPQTGRDDLAAARFRQAIGVIESVRSNLQLSTLKTDFLADKRDVYDALLELFTNAGHGRDLDLLERSRARTFKDRLQEQAQAAPRRCLSPPSSRGWTRARSCSILVTPRAAAVVWRRTTLRNRRIPFSPAAARRFLRLRGNWRPARGRLAARSEALGRRCWPASSRWRGPGSAPGRRPRRPLTALPSSLQPPAAAGRC